MLGLSLDTLGQAAKYVGTINPLQLDRFDIQNRNKSGKPTYYLDISGWSRSGEFQFHGGTPFMDDLYWYIYIYWLSWKIPD